MNSILKFLKTTLVGGIFFLIPFAVIIIILGKVLQVAQKIAQPLAKLFPTEVWGVGTAFLFGLLLLVLVSFLMGLIARTTLVKRSVDWIENNLLSNIPGYAFLKEIGKSVAGVSDEQGQQVVVAHIEDSLQIGFITEKINDELFAVYVPGAPNTMSGSVYFMAHDRFQVLDIKPTTAMTILRKLGVTSKDVLAEKI